ncbi:MAG: DUF58 domain-containing protein [Lentisphaeria bacterium]
MRLYQRAMNWYLDGPRGYPRRPRGRRYRSPALATFWWLLGLGTRLFSLPALLVLPTAVLFFLHSAMLPDARVRWLVLVMITLLATDFILGILFWPRLKIKRVLPDRVCAGQRFQIEYQVENRRNLPALALELDPGLGAYWLRCLKAPALAMLGAKKTTTLQGTYLPRQRGKYFLGQLAGMSGFPFSICRHSSIYKSFDYLLVHPAYHNLMELILPQGLKLQKSGLERIMKVSEAMEFHGCRDYREGDNPRHIHWRSSARRGDLVVREFQDEYLSRTALIVDTCLRHPKRSPSLFRGLKHVWNFFKGKGMLWPDGTVLELEAALSLTAAIAEFLLKGECLIDLFAAGKDVRHLQAGRQVAAFKTLLDILSEIEPEPNPSLRELKEEVLEEISGLGNAIVILLGFDQERRDFVEKLRERGVIVKLLLIGQGWPAPEGTTILEASDILAGRVLKL